MPKKNTTEELKQWKQIARDLATAVTPEQMIAAYDAWREIAGEEEES
jgi:hypothetical protein